MTKDGNSGRLLSSSPNTDGGPGSGNFGHEGRPGKVGGSAAGEGSEKASTKRNQAPIGSSYRTREEYESAKSQANPIRVQRHSELDKWKADEKSKLDDKYGNRILKRINVKRDKTLTENEREAALANIEAEEIEKRNKIFELESSYDEKYEKIEKEYQKVFDPEYEYDRIERDHVPEDDVTSGVINPFHLNRNCQRCAIALEMRWRGYDVQASDGEMGSLASTYRMMCCFIDAETKHLDYYDSAEITKQARKYMQSLGNGARAIAVIQCIDRDGTLYGHAFNLYTKNDEVFCADSQIGALWSDKSSIEAGGKVNLGFDDAIDAVLIRTDNVDVGVDVDEYVKKVKKDE